MTATEADTPHAEEKPVNVQQTLLDGLGGPMGMLCTTLPVVVFVTATAFLPLAPSIGIALAAALALTGFRLLRGEKPSSALGGVLAIAVAGGVAAWTGSAKDFFLIGIWASLAGAIVVLVSMLAGRPLTGVIWNLLHGGGHAWRQNRSALRAHYLASLAVLLVFAGRFVVKEWLYLADSTGWLAFAKIAMGTPLTALAALVVLWSFRRTTKVLKP
ncbi:DUF3159 domain-containing protein [Saccharopolyspora endophytica]|uniref:DUF3159 domain-containing protein n=1 Tax=Saccharopolyspora endophytica TaxID=543886 RepID=A0ABS5DFF9_9PSEU|nr:DUF3159 domain-containing protein [Saccharopolyspora endophytica]MBQ0925022.1 DUF3159 domain-containing protein [Saccharopolyspora endophytica]